jgi:hypothetical protein
VRTVQARQVQQCKELPCGPCPSAAYQEHESSIARTKLMTDDSAYDEAVADHSRAYSERLVRLVPTPCCKVSAIFSAVLLVAVIAIQPTNGLAVGDKLQVPNIGASSFKVTICDLEAARSSALAHYTMQFMRRQSAKAGQFPAQCTAYSPPYTRTFHHSEHGKFTTKRMANSPF